MNQYFTKPLKISDFISELKALWNIKKKPIWIIKYIYQF
jgi:hypothetical protein